MRLLPVLTAVQWCGLINGVLKLLANQNAKNRIIGIFNLIDQGNDSIIARSN